MICPATPPSFGLTQCLNAEGIQVGLICGHALDGGVQTVQHLLNCHIATVAEVAVTLLAPLARLLEGGGRRCHFHSNASGSVWLGCLCARSAGSLALCFSHVQPLLKLQLGSAGSLLSLPKQKGEREVNNNTRWQGPRAQSPTKQNTPGRQPQQLVATSNTAKLKGSKSTYQTV